MQSNNLVSLIVDSSTGISYERPLTVGEIAQMDRDLKESESFINNMIIKKQRIADIKQKLLLGKKLTKEEIDTMFGE
jgi:hypothetical protein